jgi:hypothetical protein
MVVADRASSLDPNQDVCFSMRSEQDIFPRPTPENTHYAARRRTGTGEKGDADPDALTWDTHDRNASGGVSLLLRTSKVSVN